MRKDRSLNIFLILFILFFSLIFYFTIFEFSFLNNKIFIDKYRVFIEDYINNNYYSFLIYFLIFAIIWTIFIGLGTPVTFFAGFFLGNYVGTLIVILSFSLGSTIFYILILFFCSNFFKNLKIFNKYIYILNRIKKNQFEYFLLFRLAGGIKMPLIIQNILPIAINMKVKNFFLATIFGMGPSTFINVSIGRAFKELWLIEGKFEFFNLIKKSEIFIPLIGFFTLSILSYFIKIFFFDTDKNIQK